MSAKKHILVPRSFTLADLNSLDHHSGKFPHMTKQEANVLERAGAIELLGEKVWQLTDDSFARPSWETGDGRVSLEVEVHVQSLMASEMRRRPSWCVTI